MVIKPHKVRILIVDDSSIWRTFLIGQLYSAGLTLVYVAYDGVQAVFKAKTLQPDVILMDVALPHKNGIQAAAEIRKSVPDAPDRVPQRQQRPRYRARGP